MDLEADSSAQLESALAEVRKATSDLRVLGLYAAARTPAPLPKLSEKAPPEDQRRYSYENTFRRSE